MLVIGVGDPDRGDDAVGPWVARNLKDVCATAISSGDPTGMIDLWQTESDVVVVDATRCDRAPGTVTVVDLLHQRLPEGTLSPVPGRGPLAAVELGRTLGTLPSSLTLVGVEGCTFDHGSAMAPAVRRGAARAAAIISSWVESAPTNPGS